MEEAPVDVAISVQGLTKSFGRTPALQGLDLHVGVGEVHGFLGPNGAGKTTTLRVLLGLLSREGGEVTLLGGDPWRDATELHRRLAYVPGDVASGRTSPGARDIDLLARLRGGLDPDRRGRAAGALRARPHEEGQGLLQGQPAEGGAGGGPRVGRRAAPARRADLRPRPAHGGRVPALRARRSGPAGGRSCSRATSSARSRPCATGSRIVRDGRTVEQGTLHELRHLTRSTIEAEVERPVVGLDGLPGVHDVEVDGGQGPLQGRAHRAQRRAGGADRPPALRDLECRPPTLEELFLRHYGHAA